MRRVGQIIGVKPDLIEAYERIHAAVWPEVLATIHACNIRNYSIFRHQELLFVYRDSPIASTELRYTGQGCRGDQPTWLICDALMGAGREGPDDSDAP